MRALLGALDDLILREIIRTGTTGPELRRAIRLARRPDLQDDATGKDQNPRMQRLVDLCLVAVRDGDRKAEGH
ncbi:hypothetical protein [Enterovirga aerilata]|uniref:Uncharacterized protein n=1 Tax=Enterovirga aerilata TaxID=2730920 RepID=A0A849IBQ5_9HYPH|nr:hypothetical protein [Enterovirga sp. DB1703]NNM73407.1 hypothetical protein [Enterovirga sp. DB1703]